MKAKIIILTPVYNDWKNLTKLLAEINDIFKKDIKKKFDLIVVNDCSTENFNHKKLKLATINKLTLISLSTNVGSQRALAIGIQHIQKTYKKNYKTIVIDSDGQDNPKGIKMMIDKSKKKPKFSIVVNRGQRKEPFWFRFFYKTYCILINLFAFKKIKFGNYCLLSSGDINKIYYKTDLHSAFPPTISINIKKILHITLDREKRFTGTSKMDFLGLVFHAFKVFSVFRYRILFSTIVYSFICYFFFNEYKDVNLFYVFSATLFIFNCVNFLISYLSNRLTKNYFKNYKIKNY